MSSKKKINIGSIENLSFGGGGGKGMANVGALLALEQAGLLPIKINIQNGINTSPNQIRGLSGASAGAFTALSIAMGYSAQDLMDLFIKYPFDKIYEDPAIGKARMIKDNMFSTYDTTIWLANLLVEKRLKQLEKFPLAPETYKEVENILTDILFGFTTVSLFENVLADGIAQGIKGTTKGFESQILADFGVYGINAIASPFLAKYATKKILTSIQEKVREFLKAKADANPGYQTVIKKITTNEKVFQHYLYNMVYDRGIFPGFEVRKFLFSLICKFLNKNKSCFPEWSKVDFANPDSIRESKMNDISRKLNFTNFKSITGIDLKVTGVNITTGTPGIFSYDSTPDFPVLDGVAISMNFPFAFKPIIIEDSKLKHLNGLWVDGGVINNLPMHVFNSPDGTFNTKTIGFTLLEGKGKSLMDILLENIRDTINQPEPNINLNEKDAGFFSTPLTHLRETLYQSQRYYSEQGQIEYIAASRDNVIDIYASYLSMLEFKPYREIIIPPVVSAYFTVLERLGIRLSDKKTIRDFIIKNHPQFKSLQRTHKPPENSTAEDKDYSLKVNDYIKFMKILDLKPEIKDKWVKPAVKKTATSYKPYQQDPLYGLSI